MRYFIGFLVTIGLIVLIIVLLVSGGGKKGAPSKSLSLNDYANSSSAVAEYVLDGPIQANETHNSIKIDVSQANVTMTVYQGYDQQVLRTQSFDNNQQSFAVFMRALHLAGIEKATNVQQLHDERGYCPSGERTIYSVSNANKQLLRSWRTSCGEGTFKGNINTVDYLFHQQIPPKDLNNLLESVNVNF